jgi:adenylate kinase
MGAPVKSAVLIDVPDSIIQERIAGRRTCPKCKAGYHIKNLPPKTEGVCDVCGAELVIRKDDNPETVKDRLVVYHRETEPLIEFYESKGLLRKVDGMTGVDNVAENFLSAM